MLEYQRPDEPSPRARYRREMLRLLVISLAIGLALALWLSRYLDGRMVSPRPATVPAECSVAR